MAVLYSLPRMNNALIIMVVCINEQQQISDQN